jgi:hypothetical protein
VVNKRRITEQTITPRSPRRTAEIVIIIIIIIIKVSKFLPQQAEVALGVPGRLSPRIFSTFETTRVEGRPPNAPATFTPGEIPGT